jgi:signal transduction histidine kinase
MVPNVLKNFGLKAAIEEIIRRFSKDNQITFNLQINKDVKIPKEKELPIYRIIQECINNAIRHGRSNKIQIEVLKKNGFTVKIADDGIGFDQLLLKHGLGLRNIEARAKSIDAVLNVESQVGKGTNIIITSL